MMMCVKYEEKKKIPRKENAFFVRVWVSRGRGCGVGRMGGWAECAVADLYNVLYRAYVPENQGLIGLRDGESPLLI
jgi:hypothetical protein